MNTPNPLVPQGSQLEQKSNARSRVKLAVFFVLSIHVVGLMALLVQGCRPEPPEVVEQPIPEVPVFYPVAPPVADTNEVLLPVVTAPPTNDDWAVGVAEPIVPIQDSVVIPPPVNPLAPQEYIIQPGDTYYSVGKKLGVSMKAIQAANPGVDPNRLQVGKTIVVPPPSASSGSTSSTPTVTAAPGENVYTVVSGDTLSSIAKKHGTTWQAIRDLNKLPTTNIKVGQKLKVPAQKPVGNGGM